MSIREAYCIELDRVISIIEARHEFLSQTIPRRYSEYHFLCSTESCRAAGVKISGACYKELPEEHKVSPYYKYSERNNKPHCADCEWVTYKIEKYAGESDKEFKLRKSRAKLHDYIDEFQLLATKNEGVITKKSDRMIQSTEINLETKNSISKSSVVLKNSSKIVKTSMLARLVEYYLNARAQFSKTPIWWELPLKVTGKPISCLHEFFRKTEVAISKHLFCVCIGDVILKETDSDFYFKFQKGFKNKEIDKEIPICIKITKNSFEQYRYRRMFRAQIDKNPYSRKLFKIYFIPKTQDLSLKKLKNKQGEYIDIYLFEIEDLSMVHLVNYSGLKKHNQA
ncbi:hypothetical protein A1D23_13015 [Chelonobacter oris]|uniref:hypothetical protein n=1 Tax=Chelonobacter oris TaxID=505317 RepID=UPI002447FD9C|nr:hypothetical protein [Chelonobacter oris]MDH3001460.1 hypothetical protein [Chelonobacter oris]